MLICIAPVAIKALEDARGRCPKAMPLQRLSSSEWPELSSGAMETSGLKLPLRAMPGSVLISNAPLSEVSTVSIRNLTRNYLCDYMAKNLTLLCPYPQN